MNNACAKLKLTFDSLYTVESPRVQEDAYANMSKHFIRAVPHSPFAVNIDSGALNSASLVGKRWRKFIRKAIKFYELFGGLNKYINSRDFSVLS
jgi:hypothetical protein